MLVNGNQLVVRLLAAVLLYFLVNLVIDTLITDPNSNKVFKIILLFLCLAIVFIGGFIGL